MATRRTEEEIRGKYTRGGGSGAGEITRKAPSPLQPTLVSVQWPVSVITLLLLAVKLYCLSHFKTAMLQNLGTSKRCYFLYTYKLVNENDWEIRARTHEKEWRQDQDVNVSFSIAHV